VDKVYYTEVDGALEPADCQAFEKGITLGDGTECLPAGLEILEKSDQALVDFFARIFERGARIQRTPMQRFLGVASRYYGHGLFRTIRYTIRKMKGEYK
jgi:hypothetical protein